MKKKMIVIFIALVLVLSACSGTSTTETAATLNISDQNQVAEETQAPTESAVTEEVVQAESSDGIMNTSYENAVSIPMQLFWGTFKLFDTEQTITKDQSVVLLPLWTNYQTLTSNMQPAGMQDGPGGQPGGQGGQPGGDANQQPQSDQAAGTLYPLSTDTAATEEQSTERSETQSQIDDLVNEIMKAMTTDQLQTIADMQITQEIAMTIMSDQGITTGGMPGGEGTPQADQLSGGPGGQQTQGTPPADMGGATQGTPSGDMPQGGNQMGRGRGGGLISSDVMNALILLLANTTEDPDVIATAQAGASNGSTSAPMTSNASSDISDTLTGLYEQDGGTETITGENYNATEDDQSAIYVKNSGTLNLSNSAITTSGDTSSQDNSSFYGLNAAVLAASGSTIDLSDSTITTSGSGANGAFATGEGSTVNLTNVTINAIGDGGHGVMATLGGAMSLENVNMYTSGKNSSAIATDRGGGTIDVTGGTVMTTGQDSPAIYSTGDITVTGSTLSASGAEAAVIEGANSITLTDASLASSMEKWGVLIYQSMSGDAEGTEGTFSMTGGKLEYTATSGPLFYVTNSTGVITLNSVEFANGSSSLIDAAAGDWGEDGKNGGQVIFTADDQILTGDLIADDVSSVSMSLQNKSSLEGAINRDNIAESISLSLDASSKWVVTADSYLTNLEDTTGISGTSITNIAGNGFTVYYDASACPALGGQTYTLDGGGYLTPAN